ncbi:hypothetical protein D3C84_1127090 [compost metagenome]
MELKILLKLARPQPNSSDSRLLSSTQSSGATWNTMKKIAKGTRHNAASHLPRVMAFT